MNTIYIMTWELSFPPRFLEFPIHRLMECSLPREKSEGITGLYSGEWVALLRKQIVAKAFDVLWQFDIDRFSSIGQFIRLQQKIMLGLFRKNRTQIQEALTVIFNSIDKEIKRLDPDWAQNNFELMSKWMDLEILLGSQTTRKNTTIWGQSLWSKYEKELIELYSKYWFPQNIKWRLKVLKRELEGGGWHVYYRWQWREANWERQLSTLRILEYMYLVEKRLLKKTDTPEEC